MPSQVATLFSLLHSSPLLLASHCPSCSVIISWFFTPVHARCAPHWLICNVVVQFNSSTPYKARRLRFICPRVCLFCLATALFCTSKCYLVVKACATLKVYAFPHVGVLSVEKSQQKKMETSQYHAIKQSWKQNLKSSQKRKTHCILKCFQNLRWN